MIYRTFTCKLFVLVTENASDEMRHIIQSLLIARAEPKLNITIQNNDLERQSNISHTYWCENLIHPRRSMNN